MITIAPQVRSLFNGLPDYAKVQLPFALSVGINTTLKDIQAAQKRGIQSRFTLRRQSFVLSMVVIRKEDFATKAQLRGRVRIGEHTGSGKSHGKQDFTPKLTRHETGGTFTDQWIPTTSLRPSFSSLVPPKMWPTALGLWSSDRMTAAEPTVRGGKRVRGARLKGKQRTFTIINRQGELVGIYQRFGLRLKEIRRRVKKGNAPSLAERLDEGIRLIWRAQPTIRISPRLGFAETAQLIGRSRMAMNVQDGLAYAIRTAKPRV